MVAMTGSAVNLMIAAVVKAMLAGAGGRGGRRVALLKMYGCGDSAEGKGCV
jgi:hypothetical protein